MRAVAEHRGRPLDEVAEAITQMVRNFLRLGNGAENGSCRPLSRLSCGSPTLESVGFAQPICAAGDPGGMWNLEK